MFAALVLATAVSLAQSYAGLTDVHVHQDGVRATISAADPMFFTRLPTPVPASYDTVVRIRVRAEKAGRWQLYWKSDAIDSYGGGRRLFFDVPAGNVWLERDLRPLWHGEGNITALRLDPPDNSAGRVEIAVFDVVQRPDLRAPFAAAENRYVIFDNVSTNIAYGMLVWHVKGELEKRMVPFTTAADGRRHTYWFDMASDDLGAHWKAGLGSWKNTIDYFELERVLDCTNFPASNIRFSSEKPNLGVDLGFTSAYPEQAIPRAGRPFPLEVIVRNYGTEDAQGIRFAFDKLPPGFEVADMRDLAPTGIVAAAVGRDSVGLGRGFEKFRLPNERRFRITFKPPPAGDYDMTLAIKAANSHACGIRLKGTIQPSLNLPKAAYVPPVKKISTGPYKIGVTSFPHWTVQHYHPVWSRAPERKPTLGWYNPGAVETVDWHIKYLAENGVSWIMLCWYFREGALGENPWIEAFQHARYRSNLKWFLQWGIYGGLEANDEAKMRRVARIWIDRYFGTPEYMKIDGMPVVNIFNAHAIDKDRTKVKKLLDALKDETVKAGYPGLYLCGQRDQNITPERFEHLASLGLMRTTVYKFIRDYVLERVSGYINFHEVAMNSPAHWRQVKKNSPLPFFPSLSTGYDMRPWYGEMQPETTVGFNLVDFKYICEEAKKFSDESGEHYLLVGPLDEWGEGSIGYPNREFGFGVLNAIRDTFGEKPPEGWPLNLCPEDVGLSVPQMYPF